MTRAAIGFDIGGSTIRAGLLYVDLNDFEIVQRGHIGLSQQDKGPENVAAAVSTLVRDLVGVANEKGLTVQSVGLGLCGQHTDSARVVVNSPNLGWRNVHFADLLEALLPEFTIVIDNDLNAILLGEHLFGRARGCDHVVAIYPGTGIGGAVMVNGRLVHGAAGFAGEVGHAKLSGDLLCGCGDRGCIETVAGGHYIESRLTADRADERCSMGASLDSLSRVRPDDVDRAYHRGESYAHKLWEQVAGELSQLAAVAVSLLNPDLILLGGGVLSRCPNLVKLIAAETRRRSPAVSARELRIELGSLGEDAGLIGSAVLCEAGR